MECYLRVDVCLEQYFGQIVTFKDKPSCDVGGSVRESSILKQFAWKRTVHMSQLLVAHKQEAAPPH